MIADPRRYPEWASNVIEVTGDAELTPNSTFRQVSRMPTGARETTFRVEELEELREIKLSCEQSGYYSRWLLTEAQDQTFADVEIGIEPLKLRYRVQDALGGKRYFRRIVEDSLDGIRRLTERARK